MKHIKNRQDFLKQKINEAFENDLKWGDSMLGRLVNSFIRKGKIAYNATRIDSLISAVKTEMDGLVGYGLPEDIKGKVDKITAEHALSEIDKTIKESEGKNGKEVLHELVSEDQKSGLVQETIELVNNSDIENKEDVAKKLNEVKTKIIEIEKETPKTSENAEKTPEENIADEKSLDRPLIKLFGNNSINIPGASTGPFEKMIKGDYSAISSDDQLLSNFSQMLMDPGFIKYIESKDVNLYQLLNKKTTVKQPQKKIPVHHESLQNIFEGQTQDGVKALINNSGKKITADLNGYLSSVSGNIATEIKNKLKSILFRGVENKFAPKESVVTFKLEPTDTLKNVGYALSLLPDGSDAVALRNKIKELGNKIIIDDKYKKRFDFFCNKLKGLNQKKNEKFITKYSDFILIREADQNEGTEEKEGEKEGETTEVPKKVEDAKKSIEPFSKKLKDVWSKIFSEDYLKKLEPNRQEADNLDKELVNKEIKIDSVDPIIRIVNTFGDAYSLYSSPVIPSGRDGGKVSNKTFREYIYLGDHGRGGTPDAPGYGPWASKSIYDKWRKGVMKIIEDPKYKEFLRNVSIKGKKEGGNILIKFMSDMLNSKGNYDDARSELLQKYFNFDEEDDGGKIRKVRGGDLKNKKANKEDIDPKQAIWARTSEIRNFKDDMHTFIMISGVQKQEAKEVELDLCIYLYKYDKKLLIKFQENSQEIAVQYLKESDIKIEAKLKSKEAKVYAGSFDVGDKNKLSVGDTIELKYVDVAIDTNDPKSDNIKNRKINIKKMFTLSKYNEGGDLESVIVEDVKTRPKADKEINSANYYKVL